jgi:putative molybdopterin biosynthesis protein
LLLVNLVYREQGLIVAKGNPLAINGLKSLVDSKIKFINRQKGAGTRILLDYLLSKNNIDPRDIHGYQKEEYTHLGVAAAVASNSVDVGMGIKAASQALDLDFVPLIEERYDICIPRKYLTDERIQKFLQVINSSAYKARVEKMGGYSTRQTGDIIWANFPIEEEPIWRTNSQER